MKLEEKTRNVVSKGLLAAVLLAVPLACNDCGSASIKSKNAKIYASESLQKQQGYHSSFEYTSVN